MSDIADLLARAKDSALIDPDGLVPELAAALLAEHAAREEAEAALHAIYDSVDYLGFPSFEEWLGSYKRRTGGTT
jgi:hypothetical protein